MGALGWLVGGGGLWSRGAIRGLEDGGVGEVAGFGEGVGGGGVGFLFEEIGREWVESGDRLGFAPEVAGMGKGSVG